MSSAAELEKLKVAELKAAAKTKGLSTVGTKKQLIERLLEASSNQSESTLDTTAEEDDDDVNEDYVLGEGDETIEDDQKSADLFINEDVMLSPVSKSKPGVIKPSVPQKENKETSPVKITTNVQDDESSSPTKIAPTAAKTLTEQERRELRAKRFNTVLGDNTHKASRAERFGIAEKGNGTATNITVTGTSAAAVVNNFEKLQQRANRFGVSTSSTVLKSEDQERLLKRKARFGIGTNSGLFPDEEERKKKRADRFGAK